MNLKKNRSRYYFLFLILIMLIAAALRLYAAEALPVDYDEPVYYRLAIGYAQAIKEGDLAAIIAGDEITNHPSLAKLQYALVLSLQPGAQAIPEIGPDSAPYPRPEAFQFQSLRLTAVLFGLINVLLLAIVDPLAGFLLAINTYSVKYTSQIYLEALPMLAITISVLAYLRSGRKWNGWLLLSAVALGITAAAKYIYCVGGIAILIDFLWHRWRPPEKSLQGPTLARSMLQILTWGLLAAVTFLIFNPYLWPDPIGRLLQSVLWNVHYSQSAHVQSSGYPFYQPLIWLFSSVPWHPAIIFTRFDGLVALVALVGLPRIWREKRVMALWWLVGMVFLLLWSTKWPQYILVVTVPVSFSAAAGMRTIVDWLGRGRSRPTNRA